MVWLFLSRLLLDVMEYKAQQRNPRKIPLLSRDSVVPQLYEAAYGRDMFTLAWRSRFMYIVFAVLAFIDIYRHS